MDSLQAWIKAPVLLIWRDVEGCLGSSHSSCSCLHTGRWSDLETDYRDWILNGQPVILDFDAPKCSKM